jgi:hypothetical protein
MLFRVIDRSDGMTVSPLTFLRLVRGSWSGGWGGRPWDGRSGPDWTSLLLVVIATAAARGGARRPAAGDTTPPVFRRAAPRGDLRARPWARACDALPLSWHAARDDVTPPPGVVYEVHTGLTAGAEDLARPTYTTWRGVTAYTTPRIARDHGVWFVVDARDAAGNPGRQRGGASRPESLRLTALRRGPGAVGTARGACGLGWPSLVNGWIAPGQADAPEAFIQGNVEEARPRSDNGTAIVKTRPSSTRAFGPAKRVRALEPQGVPSGISAMASRHRDI